MNDRLKKVPDKVLSEILKAKAKASCTRKGTCLNRFKYNDLATWEYLMLRKLKNSMSIFGILGFYYLHLAIWQYFSLKNKKFCSNMGCFQQSWCNVRESQTLCLKCLQNSVSVVWSLIPPNSVHSWLIVSKHSTHFADSFLIPKGSFEIETTKPYDMPIPSPIPRTNHLSDSHSSIRQPKSWIMSLVLVLATTVGGIQNLLCYSCLCDHNKIL